MSFSQPGFQPQGYPQQPQGYPQPGYGAPQQPQAPAPITQSAGDWWAQNSGSGAGVPSFKFTNAGDTVTGAIVDMIARQRTDPATKAPKFNKDGKPQMQLEVTLQTQLTGWAGVDPTKIPVDPTTNQPAQDDGKRRIYLWYTLRDAVVDALKAAGVAAPSIGDQLAVRLVGFEPNPVGGNPIKKYQAWVKPGSPAAQGFFGDQSQQAPAQQPVQPQQAPAPQGSPQQFQQAAYQAAAQQQAPAPQAPPAQPQGFPAPSNEPPFG